MPSYCSVDDTTLSVEDVTLLISRRCHTHTFPKKETFPGPKIVHTGRRHVHQQSYRTACHRCSFVVRGSRHSAAVRDTLFDLEGRLGPGWGTCILCTFSASAARSAALSFALGCFAPCGSGRPGDAAADSNIRRSGTVAVELQTRMKQGQMVLKLTTQRGGVPGLLHKSADLQWISDPPTGHR